MPIQHAIDQPAPIGRQPIQGRVTRIQLSRFRSYAAGDVRPEASLVALVGPNGAGKTNVLEALSLLTPGRGLRRATLSEIASDQGDGGWALNATVEAAYGETMLGTGIEGGEEEARTRICRIDRVPCRFGCGLCRAYPCRLADAPPWMACFSALAVSVGASSTGWFWRWMPSTAAG